LTYRQFNHTFLGGLQGISDHSDVQVLFCFCFPWCLALGWCVFSPAGAISDVTNSPAIQSRSGRVFSPYGPWGSSTSPSDAPLLPSPESLGVLQTGVPITPLLQAAALADLRREADGAGDGEAVEVSPPPALMLRDPISSPLSTPPSSPEPQPISLPSTVPPTAPSNPTAAINPAAQPLDGAAMTQLLQPINSRTQKQRAGKKNRQARRRREQEPNPHWTQIPASLSQTWSEPRTIQLDCAIPLDAGTARGFAAKRPSLGPRDRATPWTLPELKDRGFRLVEWDGR
jgi:hypothetical protein